jgi:hypothetical protein
VHSLLCGIACEDRVRLYQDAHVHVLQVISYSCSKHGCAGIFQSERQVNSIGSRRFPVVVAKLVFGHGPDSLWGCVIDQDQEVIRLVDLIIKIIAVWKVFPIPRDNDIHCSVDCGGVDVGVAYVRILQCRVYLVAGDLAAGESFLKVPADSADLLLRPHRIVFAEVIKGLNHDVLRPGHIEETGSLDLQKRNPVPKCLGIEDVRVQEDDGDRRAHSLHFTASAVSNLGLVVNAQFVLKSSKFVDALTAGSRPGFSVLLNIFGENASV